jgi:large subunit ribosomal protein L3
MTRVLLGDRFVPVTLLKVPTLKIVEVKTKDTHGYDAIVVGVLENGSE